MQSIELCVPLGLLKIWNWDITSVIVELSSYIEYRDILLKNGGPLHTFIKGTCENAIHIICILFNDLFSQIWVQDTVLGASLYHVLFPECLDQYFERGYLVLRSCTFGECSFPEPGKNCAGENGGANTVHRVPFISRTFLLHFQKQSNEDILFLCFWWWYDCKSYRACLVERKFPHFSHSWDVPPEQWDKLPETKTFDLSLCYKTLCTREVLMVHLNLLVF